MRVQETNGTSLWDIQVTFAGEVTVEGLRWKPTDWLTRDLGLSADCGSLLQISSFTVMESRERMVGGVSRWGAFISFEATASKRTTENSGERTMMGQVPKET